MHSQDPGAGHGDHTGDGAVGAAAVIGVAGAGTMGSGIAQLACLAGARTLLHDPDRAQLDRGMASVAENLKRGADRGRWTAAVADAARGRLERAPALTQLAPAELVIEAVPESLAIKHALFAELSDIVGERCVLATNTSSLAVTAIAAGARGPERVVGMHFFNPAPLMRLVEVVAGDASGDRALAVAHATGEAMGKRVIRASDGPGFLVNRCNRPYGLEALRLLSEGVADIPTIDRICRLGGGFRMGPFELMDLVGVDVGMEVSKSFYAQSFGEPRWRPSPIAQRMVDAGRHGRKASRGYYDYSSGEHRAPDPEPGPAGGGDGLVVIAGEGAVARELLEAGRRAGWNTRPLEEAGDEPAALALDCRLRPDPGWLGAAPRVLLCTGLPLGARPDGANAVGFHALAPLAPSRLIELTRGPESSQASAAAAERFFVSLGKEVAWVGDVPGMVLGRIVCQIINEASFALGESVGSATDIDAGMVLGVNHPRGPLEWADTAGIDHVQAVLEGLQSLYGEERYRTAPALRRLVFGGRLGRATGAGVYDYRES